MIEIEVGMLVRLRSGGPIISVNALADKMGYVSCVWFDKDWHVGFYSFHVSVLEQLNTTGESTECKAGVLSSTQDQDEEDIDDYCDYDESYGYDDFDSEPPGCGIGSCSNCDNIGCPVHPCN